jgi:hypothetical protein
MTDETRLKKLEADVTRLTYQMWGLNGSNGLVSEVRGLRADIHRWREEEEERREEVSRERVRNRLTIIAISITGCAALITAALTIAQGV